jgi:hemoglobin-like flavoprotein
MGAGASNGVKAAVQTASKEDLLAAMQELSSDDRAKLAEACGNGNGQSEVTPRTVEYWKDIKPSEDPDGHPAPITADLESPVDVSGDLTEREIDIVQQTFARVAMLGAGNVGKVVFLNIFEIAPEAKGLFPWGNDPNHLVNGRLEAHAGNVVATVGTAVSLLRDLGTLVPVLQELGKKHVGYKVVPEHYDVVGQALIKSLRTALGSAFTQAVENSWLKVFTIVKTTMVGDNYAS